MTPDRERAVKVMIVERDYYKRLLRDEPHKVGRKRRDAELRRRVWQANAEAMQAAIDAMILRESYARDPALISHAAH